MQKDFITVTPDSGNGNATISINSEFNTSRYDKNTTLSVTATENNQLSKTIQVSLQKGFSNTIGNWSGIITDEISKNSTPKTNFSVTENSQMAGSYLIYEFLGISLKIKSTDSSSELNLIGFAISINTILGSLISGISGYYMDGNFQEVLLVGSEDIKYISGYAMNDALREFTFQFNFLNKTWELSIQALKQ